MIASRQATARLQSDFYRDQFRRMVRWVMYSLVVVFLLIAFIIYKILVQPSQSYYANTTEGKILLMPRKL